MFKTTAAVLILLTMLGAGCSVAREPVALIEPSYSIRDARPGVAAAELWPGPTGPRAQEGDVLPLAAGN